MLDRYVRVPADLTLASIMRDGEPLGSARRFPTVVPFSGDTGLASRSTRISSPLTQLISNPLGFSREERPALTCRSRGDGRDLMVMSPDCSGTSCGSGMLSNPSGLSGRTWRELSPPTRVWTSHRSYLPSWAQMSLFPPEGGLARVWSLDRGGGHRGDVSTLNISACPNDVAACSLSGVLEGSVPMRFFLSPVAARGILRRAEVRGRVLPVRLREALLDLESRSLGDVGRMT